MDDKKEQFSKQDISLLFLDVDGVLNTNDRDESKKDKALLSLSRQHIERLKMIITSTNVSCKICVSSAWRLNKYSLQYLKKRLVAIGDIDCDNIIIGQTPSIPYNHDINNVEDQRVLEIKTYLNGNGILKSRYNLVSFCVIDDLDLSGIGKGNFVHTNAKFGLTESDSHAVLSILNQVPLNDEQSKQKLITLKAKPSIKLLFIAASEQNHRNINISRLQIILKKTECKLVLKNDEYKYQNIYRKYDSFTINDFKDIIQFVNDLQNVYNIQSWAVLDYNNIYQKYNNIKEQALVSRRFIKINASGLVLDDVLTTVSILNKWSF